MTIIWGGVAIIGIEKIPQLAGRWGGHNV